MVRTLVRQQVDLINVMQSNRHGCPAGIYAEGILLGAPRFNKNTTQRGGIFIKLCCMSPRRIGQSANGTHDQYADEQLEKS